MSKFTYEYSMHVSIVYKQVKCA